MVQESQVHIELHVYRNPELLGTYRVILELLLPKVDVQTTNILQHICHLQGICAKVGISAVKSCQKQKVH